MATAASPFVRTASEDLAANEVLLIFYTDEPIPAREVLSLLSAIEDAFRARGFLPVDGFIDVVAIERGSWRWKIRFNGLDARAIFEAWKEVGAVLALPASIVALFNAVPGESDVSEGKAPTSVEIAPPQNLGVAATVESSQVAAVLWNRSNQFKVRDEDRVGHFIEEHGSRRLNFVDGQNGLIFVVGTSKGNEPPLHTPLVARLRQFGDTGVCQLISFEVPESSGD